jgi:hypothetical protein
MNAAPNVAPVHRIEVRVRELNQLFNSMDPSPFYEKELDADAEEFIVGWARELPADEPFGLVVYLDRMPGHDDAAGIVTEAVQHFFAYKTDFTRRRLAQLTRTGWKDLGTGLLFLAACIFTAHLVGTIGEGPALTILTESLVIGGWVAMWRPMEVFLYERWPLKRLVRLYERMSRMPVEVRLRPVDAEPVA